MTWDRFISLVSRERSESPQEDIDIINKNEPWKQATKDTRCHKSILWYYRTHHIFHYNLFVTNQVTHLPAEESLIIQPSQLLCPLMIIKCVLLIRRFFMQNDRRYLAKFRGKKPTVRRDDCIWRHWRKSSYLFLIYFICIYIYISFDIYLFDHFIYKLPTPNVDE